MSWCIDMDSRFLLLYGLPSFFVFLISGIFWKKSFLFRIFPISFGVVSSVFAYFSVGGLEFGGLGAAVIQIAVGFSSCLLLWGFAKYD